MSSGRVSVIIPLYNHERYISQAVESVLAQGDLLKEIVVLDDGSKDSSAAVMAELARGDPRIRFFRHENRGAHATLNRGLSLATGEFVAILNSDDVYLPGRFAALTRALDLDEGSDFASSAIAFMDGDGAEIANPWFSEALAGFKRRHDVASAMIDANYLMTTSNFFVRREVFAKVGGFAALRYAHDLEFVLRCAAFGVRFCFIDRPLLRYRFHGANTILENNSKVRADWALCAALYVRRKYHGDIEFQDGRMDDIRRTLDRHRLRRAVDWALDYLNVRQIDVLDDEVNEMFRPAHQLMAFV